MNIDGSGMAQSMHGHKDGTYEGSRTPAARARRHTGDVLRGQRRRSTGEASLTVSSGVPEGGFRDTSASRARPSRRTEHSFAPKPSGRTSAVACQIQIVG